MTDATNCPGVRDDDSVRPIQMCQQCQHWRSTGTVRVEPHIVIVYRETVPVLTCTRRLAVKG